MPSERTNVASDAKRPMAFAAFAELRGTRRQMTAAAIGSQRMIDKRFMPCSPIDSGEDPDEDDDAAEEHQRVVAHVAGLEEAQQVADGSHHVADQREHAVDDGIYAFP